jgi:hypothetical protein
VDCPHCREKNPVAAMACQACGKALTIYIGPAEAIPRRVGLGSLMLLVALVAPCLVVLREVPVLGVLLLVITVPALVRTLSAVSTRKSDGRPMITAEMLSTFGASLGIVWLIEIAALLAFGAASFVLHSFWSIVAELWPHRFHPVDWEWSLYLVIPPAVVMGVVVAFLLGRKLWTLKN